MRNGGDGGGEKWRTDTKKQGCSVEYGFTKGETFMTKKGKREL